MKFAGFSPLQSKAILALSLLLFLGLAIRWWLLSLPLPEVDPQVITLFHRISDSLRVKESGLDSAASPAALTELRPVNLNRADESELQSLPGVGAVIAARIIAYRQERGGFSRVDDLLEIKGIGQKTLEKLRPHVYVDDE